MSETEQRMAKIIALILKERTNTIVTKVDYIEGWDSFTFKDDQGNTFGVTIRQLR